MNRQSHLLFSAGELLNFSWSKTRENLKPLLVIGGVSMVLALLNGASSRSGNPAGFDLLNLVVQLFQVAVTMAWIRVALAIADGKPVEVPKARELWPDYFVYLITTIITGIAVGLGFVALIVPGVVLGLMFGFSGFAVIDQKMDPIQAMKESARITTGAKPELFGLALLLLALNFAGALALGIGLLVTIPMSFIALAQVYRRLQDIAVHAPPAPRPIAGPPAPVAH